MTSNDRQSHWPTPEEFVSEWDERTPEARLALAERIINDAQIASKCFVMDHEGNIGMLERALVAHRGRPCDGKGSNVCVAEGCFGEACVKAGGA